MFKKAILEIDMPYEEQNKNVKKIIKENYGFLWKETERNNFYYELLEECEEKDDDAENYTYVDSLHVDFDEEGLDEKNSEVTVHKIIESRTYILLRLFNNRQPYIIYWEKGTEHTFYPTIGTVPEDIDELEFVNGYFAVIDFLCEYFHISRESESEEK